MTLEEVVKHKEQMLAEPARDAVQKAYEALTDLWGHFICKRNLSPDDAFNLNVVNNGLGKPKRFKVVITERWYPIRYCDVETFPASCRLENFFKGLMKDGEYFRTFNEVDDIIPKEISGILNNGHKLRALENGERGIANGIELTYEEVLPD